MKTSFNLSEVFATAARTVPDRRVLMWRDREFTYAQMNQRVDGVANYLASRGLGCHTERDNLSGHESGQDHVGLYLRNGNEYLEAMIGAYRARTAPFNVSYRYVEAELVYLLEDADARALVYQAEFAPMVAEILGQLPRLEVLIQVADVSGNDLVPGAVDYESVVTTPSPPGGLPTPSGDDLYIVYTGGTTGMPKGVLWRQHDIFVSSMGGRPFGSDQPFKSYDELARQIESFGGHVSLLVVPPFIHGAGQWAAFHIFTQGGWLAIPDDVERLQPGGVLRLAERERIVAIPVVGDAIARPLIDEIERGDYDLSGLMCINNGAASMSQGVRRRILKALPHVMLIDAVGASETGVQMNTVATEDATTPKPSFTPQGDTAVVAHDFSRVLTPGEGEGWLARKNYVPLGYLKDAEKTARAFPHIDGERWSVPGDRAVALADGNIELLGRDSATINSGGEKIFAEEVERAVAGHPDVYDVVVVGRPSERWGSEVVALIQLVEGAEPSDDELADACRREIARYKIPKAFVRTRTIVRSPAGKADYRWAAAQAVEADATTG